VIQRLLRLGLRQGVSKGLMGGSRPWLVVGGVALGWQLLRRIAGGESVVVYSEKLEPGDTLVIAHGREPV
jgi:hypothetical protein